MPCKDCPAKETQVLRYTKAARRTFIALGTEQAEKLPGFITGVSCASRFDLLKRDCCTVTFKVKKGELVYVNFIAESKSRVHFGKSKLG
jgi:hypothetical protein